MLTEEKVLYLSKKYDVSPEKVRRVESICVKYGISLKFNVFKVSTDNLQKVIDILIKNGLEPEEYRTALREKPEHVETIIKICKDNGLDIESQLFENIPPERIEQSIDYVRKKYGNGYVITHIVMRDPNKLSESMPVFKSLGLLRYTRLDASVFDLTKEEIIDRTAVLTYLGEPLHRPGRHSKIDRINRVFTYSKEKFENYCEEFGVTPHIRKANYERVVRIMKAFEARKKSVK